MPEKLRGYPPGWKTTRGKCLKATFRKSLHLAGTPQPENAAKGPEYRDNEEIHHEQRELETGAHRRQKPWTNATTESTSNNTRNGRTTRSNSAPSPGGKTHQQKPPTRRKNRTAVRRAEEAPPQARPPTTPPAVRRCNGHVAQALETTAPGACNRALASE